MKTKNREIILASTSPRRKQLMGLLGIKFKVADSGYVEITHKHLSHEQLVKFLALGKSRAAAKKYPSAVIIAADTMVSFRGRIIGKPQNKSEAINMLKSFSGKSQDVVSGTVVLDAESGKALATASKIKIYFKKLSNREILAYVNSGEPYDKAGSYNLQGTGFNLIDKIQGNISDGLGMSIEFVFNALQKLKVKI